MSEPDYHFIVGIPRSGTTLLSFMFNRSNKILALHEPKHILHVIKDYKHSGLKSLYHSKSYFKKIEQLHNIKESPFKVNPKKNKETWKMPFDERSVKKISTQIALSFEFLNKKNTQIDAIIDKNPAYTINLDNIISHFPKAKFIITTRDYRAFTLSRMEKRKPHKKIHSYINECVIWNYMHKFVFEAINKYPEKCLLIKYEELTSNPEIKMREICNFLNLDFSYSMLKTEDFELNQKLNIDSFSTRKKVKYTDLSKPINIERNEAWKTKLTNKNIRKLDALCHDYGQQLGYLPAKPISKLARTYFKLMAIPYKILIRIQI